MDLAVSSNAGQAFVYGAETADRIQAKKFHLTYRGHLPLEWLLQQLRNKCVDDFKWYSLVHEVGTSGELGYDHTHVAFCTLSKVSRSSMRFFDVMHDGQIIHPHIRVLSSDTYARNVWHYHAKDPVNRLCSDASPVTMADRSLFDAIRRASTLDDALVLAGVVPRNVTDVIALRNDVTVDTSISPLANPCQWLVTIPP